MIFFLDVVGCKFVVIVVVWGVIVAKARLLWLKGCWLWPDEAIFFPSENWMWVLYIVVGYIILLYCLYYFNVFMFK